MIFCAGAKGKTIKPKIFLNELLAAGKTTIRKMIMTDSKLLL